MMGNLIVSGNRCFCGAPRTESKFAVVASAPGEDPTCARAFMRLRTARPRAERPSRRGGSSMVRRVRIQMLVVGTLAAREGSLVMRVGVVMVMMMFS